MKVLEDHSWSVQLCMKRFNATSIKDIKPAQYPCVGKCVMDQTGLIDSEGKPRKDKIFNMVTDVFPPEVRDLIKRKYEKCLDEESADVDPEDESCTSYLPLCACIHEVFRMEC